MRNMLLGLLFLLGLAACATAPRQVDRQQIDQSERDLTREMQNAD